MGSDLGGDRGLGEGEQGVRLSKRRCSGCEMPVYDVLQQSESVVEKCGKSFKLCQTPCLQWRATRALQMYGLDPAAAPG